MSDAVNTDESLVYESLRDLTRDEIEEAILRDEPQELRLVVLSAALYLEDAAEAENICLRLAAHVHFNVRGNALLGFGHIARIHSMLDEARIRPILLNGLQDEHEYVRGHAFEAVEDTKHFLKWKF